LFLLSCCCLLEKTPTAITLPLGHILAIVLSSSVKGIFKAQHFSLRSATPVLLLLFDEVIIRKTVSGA
jgi:hypothetical protein